MSDDELVASGRKSGAGSGKLIDVAVALVVEMTAMVVAIVVVWSIL